jgi:pimeloyl-ACP methyl ester carboxylesterase
MKKFLGKLTDVVTFATLTRPKIRRSHHYPRKDEFEYYYNEQFLTDPELFYVTSETIPNVAGALVPINERPSCHVYDFQFDSPILSPWKENNTVYGRYFKTTRRTDAPTVIMLHGWLAANYIWYSSLCRKMARLGIDSFIVQLPYHIQRRPAVSLYSGEYAVSGDITRSIEMVRQAVADVRRLLNWIKATAQGPVGLWSVSLGGWAGAMALALDPRFDFAVLMIPVARPDDVVWHSALCAQIKQDIIAAGISFEEVQRVLKVVTPKYFQPALAPEKILLVEAEVDQVVFPHTVEEMWDTWRRPHLRRYPHGHNSITLSPRAINDTLEFIQGVT